MGLADEFKTIELLNRRAVLLAERLGQKPSASISNACQSWAETAAAYRFLRNEEVSWDKVLAPYWQASQASQARMAQHKVVLCIQDTTELDYNGQAIAGLGPLSYEAQRDPLGVFNAWTWAREFKGEDGQRAGLCESGRWIESYERIAESAQQLPDTRHVCIGDRESDMLELMLKARDLGYPADYLVRSQHNRVLPEGGKLWDQVMAQTPIGRISFMLPAGRGRKSRMVEQDIRLQRLSLKDKAKGRIEVTCVIASEVNAPEGAKPVQWRLLTNREAHTLEQASGLIDWYRERWEIELFFLILKEGCRVERLQLSDKDRLESALAIYMVIAWRINRLMRLGRTVPNLEAGLVFEPDEWRAALILNKKPVPKKMPTLNEVIRLIAQRGGFLGRKGDGEPGARTLWLGLQEIAIFVEDARYAREFSEAGACV